MSESMTTAGPQFFRLGKISRQESGASMAAMPPKDFVLANENFTLFRTTPIFYQHSDLVDGPIASGTYFAIRKRVFLITAGHTITEYKFEPKHFLVPDRPKSSDFTDLGDCNLSCTRFRRHRVRCFMEQEVRHGEKAVYTGVQA